MVRRRFSLTVLPLLSVVAALSALILPPAAHAARPPTSSELRALRSALSRDQDVAITPSSVSIATVAPGWAAVKWGHTYNSLVFHRHGNRWRAVGNLIQGSEPFDSPCAYAPSVVITDLFAIRCPPYAALHARPASSAVRKALDAALRADPYTRSLGPFTLYRPCISRLNPRWAAATVELPDTAEVVWLHQNHGRWQVNYGFQHLPPRAIILSLAACSAYNAAAYGA